MKKEWREGLPEVARQYQLRLLILFGSQANGKSRPDSDIDIGFLPPHGHWDREKEAHLYDDIMAVCGTEKIDLINIWDNHNAKLRFEILSQGKVLYESEKGLHSELKGPAWIDYLDMQRFTKRRGKLNKRRAQEMMNQHG